MATSSALETLIDLAQRDSDAIAKRLGAALKAVEEAEQKLVMLDGYRDEYVRKLDVAWLRGQAYLAPHPEELMLRNHV